MRRPAALVLLLAALFVSQAAAQGTPPPSELLSVRADLRESSGGAGTLVLEARLAAGWHVNSHKPSEEYLIATSVSLGEVSGVEYGQPRYPEGVIKTFAFSKTPLSVYEGRFTVEVPVRWTEKEAPALSGSLEYQACNDERCLPPATAAFQTAGALRSLGPPGRSSQGDLPGGALPLEAASKAGASPAGASQDFASKIARSGYLLVLLSVFVGGLALNLTPCVYPVIPLTIGFFGGQSGGNQRRVAGLAFLYVAGIVLMYSALGVAAALSGRLFGALLQSPWVLTGIAGVLILLALSMFGLYELRMPSSLMRRAGSRTGAAGAFAMGLLVGVVAAPCVAPFTLGLLAFVAERQSIALGALFFSVLSLGLGLPYVFLAIFSGNLSRLPRAGAWMEGVKKIFGWLLLALAAYFLRLVLPKPWSEWLLPVTLLAGAVALAVKGFGFARLVRFAAAVLFLAAALFFLPRKALGWQPYDAGKLAAGGRPSVIDFTADWCLPCLELDQRTFSDPRVRKELSRRELFKADLTKANSPEAAALSRKHEILGVPTVIFLDASGRERKDLRLVGFEDADRFLARLAKAP